MKAVAAVIIFSVLGSWLSQIPTVEAATQYMHKVAVSQPCPRNKYVFTYENRTKICLRCSQCQKGFQVQTKCSTYNDTICEHCPSGWYSDVRGSRCKPCSGCKSGEYVRRTCIAKRDTKCRKCPKHTYSLSANVTMCLPCKRCRQHEIMISKCSGVKDTDCGDCRHGYFRESSTGICLPCSPCPTKLQHLVVPECRDKLGIHHSHICWPGHTRVQFRGGVDENYNSYKSDDNSLSDITETILDVELEDYKKFRESVMFTTYLLGSVLTCAVFVIISVSIIVRFTKCERCANLLKLDRYGNDEPTDSESIKSQENFDKGSLKLNDCYNTDFGTDLVSLIENESLLLEDMSVQTNSDGLSSSLDYAEEVCVRTSDTDIHCKTLPEKGKESSEIYDYSCQNVSSSVTQTN